MNDATLRYWRIVAGHEAGHAIVSAAAGVQTTAVALCDDVRFARGLHWHESLVYSKDSVRRQEQIYDRLVHIAGGDAGAELTEFGGSAFTAFPPRSVDRDGFESDRDRRAVDDIVRGSVRRRDRGDERRSLAHPVLNDRERFGLLAWRFHGWSRHSEGVDALWHDCFREAAKRILERWWAFGVLRSMLLRYGYVGGDAVHWIVSRDVCRRVRQRLREEGIADGHATSLLVDAGSAIPVPARAAISKGTFQPYVRAGVRVPAGDPGSDYE